MEISKEGIKFLIELEGYKATMYKDSAGLDTIGVGHLVKIGEVFKQPLSVEAISKLLEEDLDLVETAVDSLILIELTQNQFDALCCLVFNIGIGAFTASTVRKVINRKGSLNEVRGAWLLWKRVGGIVSKGLLSRRFKEIRLYGSY